MRRTAPFKSLSGSLLAAMPGLMDPHFRRTLLVLSHHDASDGAVGLILNRPKGITLGDLDPTPEGLGDLQVLHGGPVGEEKVILARLSLSKGRSRFEPIDPDDPEILAGNPGRRSILRAFTGYAGWSAGQLEEEVAEGSWMILPATAALLGPVEDRDAGIRLWKSLMRGLDPWQRLLAEAPDHPERN